MVYLTTVSLSCFRNLKCFQLEPAPTFNFFYGANGTGKTSLLEAIYYLSGARSFRVTYNHPLIHHGEDALSVFAKVKPERFPYDPFSMGIRRARSGALELKLAGHTQQNLTHMARCFPVLAMSPMNDFALLNETILQRRFLDWFLFHVEPLFFSEWRQFMRVLKQRNAALKLTAASSDIRQWDQLFSAAAIPIADRREALFKQLLPRIKTNLSELLPHLSVEIGFSRGWPADCALEERLIRDFSRDQRLGYTGAGPHRANFIFLVDGTPATHVLSRGQQKLFLYALYFAIGALFKIQYGEAPVYLFDDFLCELDRSNRLLLADCLGRLPAQVFATTAEKEDLDRLQSVLRHAMFHVEQSMKPAISNHFNALCL